MVSAEFRGRGCGAAGGQRLAEGGRGPQQLCILRFCFLQAAAGPGLHGRRPGAGSEPGSHRPSEAVFNHSNVSEAGMIGLGFSWCSCQGLGDGVGD